MRETMEELVGVLVVTAAELFHIRTDDVARYVRLLIHLLDLAFLYSGTLYFVFYTSFVVQLNLHFIP